MNRGAERAIIEGVMKSQTGLNDWHFLFYPSSSLWCLSECEMYPTHSYPINWTNQVYINWIRKYTASRNYRIWEEKFCDWKVKVLVAQSCQALWDPIDCSRPDSSVHGIFQARLTEWVTIPFSRGSCQPSDWTQTSHIAGRFFTIWATREALFVNWDLP